MIGPLDRSLLAGLALCVLSACTSEPPPVPPAELVPSTSEVTLLRLWSAKIGDAGRGRFEPWISEEQVIVANRKGKLTSLARDNGMRQWSTELEVSLTSGVGGSADQVYVSDTNGVVHALDPQDGSPVWESAASSEILVPVAADYGVAIVRSTDGRVAALEPADGSERWTVSNTPPALTVNGYSRPLLLDGGVLIGLDDGRLLALNLANGKLIWEAVLSVPSGRSEVERLVDIDSDIVIDDEGIYVANYQGKAAKLEPSRGQIVWSIPLSAGSGMALLDNRLVVVDDADTVHMFDKESGQTLWTNDTMPGRRLSPPAFTPEGHIVFGDVQGYIHVLDSQSGASIGRTRLTDEPITSRPYQADDAVYVQATDGIIAAYRFAR